MRDLDSRLLDLSAFSSARHENRVCVVYVCVDFPARPRLTQHLKAAIADGQMIHLARAAGARTHSGQLAVSPKRAVKNHDARILNGAAQFVGQFTNTRRQKYCGSRDGVAKLKCDACAQFNHSKSDLAIQRLEIGNDVSPFDSAEVCQNIVDPCERRFRFIGGIRDHWRVLLTQKQQAQRVVDVGVGQKKAGDGSVAYSRDRRGARLQLRHGFDLACEIWRRIDQEAAVKTVSADGDTRLRLRGDLASAGSDAVNTGTVPLRQTTAG